MLGAGLFSLIASAAAAQQGVSAPGGRRLPDGLRRLADGSWIFETSSGSPAFTRLGVCFEGEQEPTDPEFHRVAWLYVYTDSDNAIHICLKVNFLGTPLVFGDTEYTAQ